MNNLIRVFVAKAVRVFVFGVVSVVTPVYLDIIGYSPFLVGVAVAVMIGGNAASNVLLFYFEDRIGRRRFLTLFSLLMLVSGLVLFSSTSFSFILFACFIGNISTTGTETGPFQSVEAGVLPKLVPAEKQNRSFGVYNLIGYSASSVGAFVASAPAYFQNSHFVFRLLYLTYGLIGLALIVLYSKLGGLESPVQGGARRVLTPPARREITKLSALFSIDAFGGGFVSQSLLAYWFYFVYGVSLNNLGVIFFVVNVITAVSTLGASYLADRIGNLRTMVYTHLLSNAFLVLIPFAGSLALALLFLFARQSVSQMDVPTRQAFMAGIFADEERVSAYATTNTSRIVSGVFGGPIFGALVGMGFVGIPLLIAGFSKITYDGLVYSAYRYRAR